MIMRNVILESPYAGDVEENVKYAKRCLLDCLRREESPIASHLLLTMVLDDDNREERALGVSAGHSWVEAADAVVFYLDRGMSQGMIQALIRANELETPMEFRYLERSDAP